MKALVNISGGAIKFIALLSAFIQLLKTGVKVRVITSSSSGAIVAFLYVCGRLEQGLQIARRSHDIRVIFSKKNQPVGRIGGFSLSAIWKILRGKNYIGIMDNLETNIRELCSSQDFWRYKENPDSPDCYILAVEAKTGKHVMANLKTLSYNEAISLVIGSSTIAPTIKEREFYGMKINDGGHRGHSAGAYLLRSNIDQIKGKINKCFSIYSRPEPEEYENQELNPSNNFFNRLVNFTIGTFIKETSLNDEYVERNECGNAGIEYIPIYIPKFTKDTYKATPEEIKKGEQLGIWAVGNYYLE